MTQKSFSFDSVLNDFEKEIQQDITHGGSFSVAIGYKDQIVWAKAFGFSDEQPKEPADSSTIYRIGSITKTFTAIVMMKLADQGILKLGDPVEIYLPEIKNVKGYIKANKITFLQLASHTSGLERDPQAKDAANDDFSQWEKKVLQAIPFTSVKFRPGEKFLYSNIGYSFLGLALSRAAKQPFTSLVEQYIFNPLQMQSSSFVVPADKAYHLAKRLRPDSNGDLVDDPPGEQDFSYGYLVPCGGVFASAPDLLKFAIANLGFSSIVNTKDRELMQTPRIRMTSSAQRIALRVISLFLKREDKIKLRVPLYASYGLGFEIYSGKKGKIVGHSGVIGSYHSSLFFEEVSGYSVAILCNYKPGKIALENACIQILSKLSGG